MVSGPLSGVRILEFSQIVSLPFGGAVLSDLGAEVIKVEPLRGDPHRNLGAVVPNESKRFQSLNRGKRSLAVDLNTAAGREAIYRLVQEVDVVTCNYRFGVAERLGIDYETLKAHNPALIYCEVTGFGNEGPMRNNGGTDIVANAYSGLMAGDRKINEDGLPANITATSLADYVCGFSAAVGVCSALYHRQRTGEGQKIDASLLGSALAVQDTQIMRDPVSDAVMRDPMMAAIDEARARNVSYTELLDVYRGRRGVPRSAFFAFYRAYETKDGIVVLGALTPAGRVAARKVLDLGEDGSDLPDFDARDPANIEAADCLITSVEELMRTRTVTEWVKDFGEAGVPVAPLNLPEDMADDPQVLAMGMMTEIEHTTGKQRVPGPVVRMSVTPTAVQGASPALGVDTELVLRYAGFSDEELSALRDEGAIA
ncbi:MAG: CoA transferase [Dehalococcoidia bacterium]|jgi:crotonobetainyl-CoA:carnitine CoA-transferase CaiB-like acyl-CoA transferase|nr:CoA transferase [Dehalococcoidia bacterium]